MKRTILFTAALLLLLSAVAFSGDRFPAGTWQMYASPEEAGFSAEKLAEAKAYWESIQSAAAMLVHDGAVVVAWGDVERRFLLHSARKSIMSGIYGIHVDAGEIDLDKNMWELGIDDENPPLNDAEKQATIFDLIRARSGVYHLAAAEPPQNPKPPRGSHAPGTYWCYNNWDFNALCTIIEQELGIKVFEDFEEHFAEPIGMEDYHARDGVYMYERNKSIHPAYHIRMSARDMARFGLLYLKNGSWDGERILSEHWVTESTRSHSRTNRGGGYGYMWWVSGDDPFADLGMYSALGVGHQSIEVLPGANMVFVHRTDTYNGRKVSGEERLELLRMLLAAQTGEPKDDIELVPLPYVPRPFEPVMLAVDEMKALCEKPTDPSSLQLTYEFGGLYLEKILGTFSVIPVKGGRFLLDDTYREIFIEKNDDGTVKYVITERDLTEKSYELLDAGKNDEAIAALKKALDYYPRSATVFDLLAGVYAEKGDLEQAAATYRRLLEIDPENTHAMTMIERLEIAMDPVTVPDETLASYAGVYGNYTIILESGTLYAQRQGDAKRFTLVAKTADYFLIEGVDYPRVRFIKGDGSAVEAMELIMEKERVIRVEREE